MNRLEFFPLIVILLFFIIGCSEKIENVGINEQSETVKEEPISKEINEDIILEENEKESDLIQNESLVTEENQSDNEGKNTKVWMSKRPHQCGDNTVPNDIYFDYPSTLFDNEGLPDFPINFSQKKNAMEFYNKEIEYYEKQMRVNGRSEDEINEYTAELMEYHASVLGSLSEDEIIIYDATKIHMEGIAVCAACSCPTTYTVYLLIDESDIDVLLNLGYTQTEEPTISE